MKLQGYLKGSGKLGNIVVSRVAGETIARDYNPNVSNPSTASQVDQRAKLKLMSQLSAAFAPVIAIPRQGLKSGRNQFVAINFEQCIAQGGVAQVTYENLQLTKSSIGLPAIQAQRVEGTGITVSLASAPAANISRVVYVAYKKSGQGQFELVASSIASAAGANGTWPVNLPATSGDVALFAYGVSDLNSKATAKFGNYAVANGQDFARLLMERKISTSDVQLTQTRGATLFSGESETTVVPDGYARVFVTPVGQGTVTGAGVFEIGSQVTVTATPGAGVPFLGWRLAGSNTIIATTLSYTFTLNGQTDIVAVFGEPVPSYTVSVTPGSGSLLADSVEITNDGIITQGSSCTVAIGGGSGLFEGIFDSDGRLLTTQRSYTFTPEGDTQLTYLISSDEG